MKIGCLPVVGEGRELLGLITGTDVIHCFVTFVENNES